MGSTWTLGQNVYVIPERAVDEEEDYEGGDFEIGDYEGGSGSGRESGSENRSSSSSHNGNTNNNNNNNDNNGSSSSSSSSSSRRKNNNSNKNTSKKSHSHSNNIQPSVQGPPQFSSIWGRGRLGGPGRIIKWARCGGKGGRPSWMGDRCVDMLLK